MQDNRNRNIHYARLSITDKCNLACRYCMPTSVTRCAHEEVLSYEEIERIVSLFAKLGIDVIRITGGEPLVRKDVEKLISNLKKIPGIQTIGMTTNGYLLKEKLDCLIDAGLDSVNISLDTLKKERFQEITGIDGFDRVWEGIEASIERGLLVKLNCVPQKHINEDELLDLARIALKNRVEVRFIELMPIGEGKPREGICNQEIKKMLEQRLGPLQVAVKQYGNGPSVCYKTEEMLGRIGFISPMHGKFCRECNRIRLTSRGFLKGCLASEQGKDLRILMKNGASDDELLKTIEATILQKPLEHHFENEEQKDEKAGMYAIGG